MSYLPETPIKYVKAATTATALNFGTHLWDYLDNQDAEFCRKSTARYDNTPLKGLYYSNWFFNIGSFSVDWQFTVRFNTVGDNFVDTNYSGATFYRNIYMCNMSQIYGTTLYHSSVMALGSPIYGINSSATKNSVGAARATSRNLSSHIFMLPVAENQ